MKTRNSAAYKGFYALLMDDETKDWLSATRIDFSTYFSESIDVHHIFPVAWCEKNEVSRRLSKGTRQNYEVTQETEKSTGKSNIFTFRRMSGKFPLRAAIGMIAGLIMLSFMMYLE